MEKTRQSPMPIDQIIGVLGYVVGSAIANHPHQKEFPPRQLRELVHFAIDNAMAKASGSSLILPAENGRNIGIVKS